MDVSVFKRFDFFTGVPDSLLKPLCDWLQSEYGDRHDKHIIAANEGNAVGIAAGYHLSTGKVPVVYLQNSGIGNIANPVASLINEKVYGIPMLFVIGWRGEPGVKDEPQHIFQGEITVQQLKNIGISTYIIDEQTTEEDFSNMLITFVPVFAEGKSVAVVARKDTFVFNGDSVKPPSNGATMLREDILKRIAFAAKDDLIITTTGKTSRELFEIRKQNNQSHDKDFLTVGSMGHCSSIALGVALHNPQKRVWIIDGDGSALMHMGAMATMGAIAPKNLVHVIINNASHESVGGMPTVAGNVDFSSIGGALGYPFFDRVNDEAGLSNALDSICLKTELCFLEILSAPGSRENLGRPDVTTLEAKRMFAEQCQL